MPFFELPGDPDTITKGNTTGPGVGGNGGGPGGGFGGFGGGSFLGGGFGNGSGQDPMQVSRLMGGQGAGPNNMIAGALHAAYGGHISGPGTPTSDSIPARLSDGEFVVNAAVAKQPGVREFLDMLNKGHFHDDVPEVKHYMSGGAVQGYAGGGPVRVNGPTDRPSPGR